MLRGRRQRRLKDMSECHREILVGDFFPKCFTDKCELPALLCRWPCMRREGFLVRLLIVANEKKMPAAAPLSGKE